MASDPSSWALEQLEAHARAWCELPLMQVPPVMDDVDAEAHGDLLYIRGMIDDLTAAKAELQREINEFHVEHGQFPAEPVMCMQYLCHSAEAWIPGRLEFSEPWPGVLLEAWRGDSEAAA